MSNVAMATTLALALFTGVQAARAQVFGGDCPGGGAFDPGSGPNPDGDDEQGSGATVKSLLFRYYSDHYPSALPPALKKVSGVGKVEIDSDARAVRVEFNGGMKQVGRVEAAAAGSGVKVALISHARLQVSLKAVRSGADPKGLREDLSGAAGLRSVRLLGATAAELCADLESLDIAELREIAGRTGFDLALSGHEWVILSVPGPATAALERQLIRTTGILTLRSADGAIGMWTLKKIGDSVFRKLGEKSGVMIDAIARM